MNDIHPSYHQIIRYIFPEEILEYFEITGINEIQNAKTDDITVEIVLEERNTPPIIPEQQRGKRIHSKGFHRPLILQNFPLQDKFCLLKIKRRRWEIEDAGTITRTLSFIPESGLKLTTDFAAFLKEADRTRTSGGRTHRETLWNKETGESIQG